MMRLRYGDNFARTTQAISYGETVRLGDVTATFHPAGHVLGSVQVAVTLRCAGTLTPLTPPHWFPIWIGL